MIQGLDQGTYYLKEIQAPDGYTLLKEAIEIQITPTFVADRNNYTSNGEDWFLYRQQVLIRI